MIELRPEVRAFAEEMETRLQMNDHKVGWDDSDRGWLEDRLFEEVLELVRAKTTADIMLEAEDVANFAMFIHYNARTKGWGERDA